jgi:hypothetical protein
METRCFFKAGSEFLNIILMIFVFQWLKYIPASLLPAVTPLSKCVLVGVLLRNQMALVVESG